MSYITLYLIVIITISFVKKILFYQQFCLLCDIPSICAVYYCFYLLSHESPPLVEWSMGVNSWEIPGKEKTSTTTLNATILLKATLIPRPLHHGVNKHILFSVWHPFVVWSPGIWERERERKTPPFSRAWLMALSTFSLFFFATMPPLVLCFIFFYSYYVLVSLGCMVKGSA